MDLDQTLMNKLKSALYNIKTLYKAWNNAITYFDDYSSIISERKYKTIHGERFKILTPKRMLQRLPIALVQVKAGNTPANLLNKILQIMHSFYWADQITKKVYNNIMNSKKLWYDVDTTFINSEIS